MKLFFLLIIFILLNSCSFDDKTGIWDNEQKVLEKKKENFKDFKKISSTYEIIEKEKNLNQDFTLNIPSLNNNSLWNDIYFSKNNNLANFNYETRNELFFISRQVTKYKTSKYLLFQSNNLIINDEKGNLNVFSINENKLISKFNFYKKKYKNTKKKLNLSLDKNNIYVTDNLGFVYVYNYEQNKILWAKNLKIPFRSNIKITNNFIITADQNNNLYFFDKKNGNLFSTIPTEETIVKNSFVNNISIDNDEKNLYFLNSYGSLYSIDLKNLSINWFINLNQSLDLNPSNLFLGSPVVNNDKYIIVSSNQNTYILNKENGSIVNKKNFSITLRPIVKKNYAFFVTKNNFLISVELSSGNTLYAYDILKKHSSFKEKN